MQTDDVEFVKEIIRIEGINSYYYDTLIFGLTEERILDEQQFASEYSIENRNESIFTNQRFIEFEPVINSDLKILKKEIGDRLNNEDFTYTEFKEIIIKLI